MSEVGILNTLLSEISLLYILILLVPPYIIFYLLDRNLPKGFDKFTHWEGGLFIFGIGSLFYIISVSSFGTKGINWVLLYLLLLFVLTICLVLYYRENLSSKPNKTLDEILLYEKPLYIAVELKSGIRYVGYLYYLDRDLIGICEGKKTKIILIRKDDEEIKLDINLMFFRINEIELFYC